ncbi:MAG: EAL domain-containing protein [Alphaproteobacteria bacterium]
MAQAFSSPWLLDSPYWIVLHCADPACREAIVPALKRLNVGVVHGDAALAGWRSGPDWAAEWEKFAGSVKNLAELSALRVAVLPADTLPSAQEIRLSLRPFAEIDAIAANLWLAVALAEDKLICFMQRVLDRRGKLVGFEAFARIEQEGGKIVSGGAVMQASHALHVEYQVDRMLHREAIKSFVEFDLEGFVFINFLTGFIHRPEVYLEGLSQAVEGSGLLPRFVALDVPLPDYANNVAKIKTIATYCRSRGFAMALDDVMTPEGLGPLLADIRPAFVKLDARLGPLMLDGKRQSAVVEIIRLAHESGASVLAEGVESEALYQHYLNAGVDMFQGYYFGAPERYPPLPAQAQVKGS